MLRQIREADFVGLRDAGGHKQAEILVTLHNDESSYRVFVEQQNGGHLHVASVVKEQADPALDWFDNDMHSAALDITDSWFNRADVETNWTERESFMAELLAHEKVGPKLREVFGNVG